MTTETEAVRRDVDSEEDPMQSPQRAHPKPLDPMAVLTANQRLAAIKERCALMERRPIYNLDEALLIQEVPWLLSEEARFRDAVRTCGDDGECPACWEVYFEGITPGADRRTHAELQAEVERLRDLLTRLFMLRAAGALIDTSGFPEVDTWLSDAHAALSSPSTTYTEGRKQGDLGVPPSGSGLAPNLAALASASVPHASNPTTEAKG